MGEKLFMALFNASILMVILFFQLLKSKTNNNILLGIEVPENRIKSEQVKNIVKGFRKESLTIGIVSMAIIALFVYFIDNIIFFVVSIFIYLFILLVIYLRWHKKTNQLGKKGKWDKLIKKQEAKEEKKNKLISQKWFLLPLFIILLNLLIGLVMYPFLPDKLPIHWNYKGLVDAYMDKSIMGVLLFPIMQLFLAIVIYVIYTTIKKGKNHENPRDPEGSVEKNIMFKKIWSWYFIVTLSLVEVLLSILNMMTFGFIKDIRLFNLFSFIIIGLIIVGAIILSIVVGQGGHRLKVEKEKTLKKNYENDKFWKLANIIYFNPENPRVFIEKRVGLGWTVNLGRPFGLIIMVFPIVIIVFALIFIK